MAIRQSTLNLASGLVFLGLSLGLAGTVYYAGQSLEAERAAVKRQAEFRQLGIDLADASDYLTDEARKFAVLGDLQHLRNYWREIEETRTRDRVLARLRELRAPPEELALLETAKRHSDELVATELRSMRLMLEALGKAESDMPTQVAAWKLGDSDRELEREEKMQQARHIMFDARYAAAKQTIMEPVARFQTMLDARAAREVADAADATLAAGLILLGLCVLIPTGMFGVLWLFRRRVSVPIEGYIAALRGLAPEDNGFQLRPAGTWELHVLAESFNQQFRANQEQLQKNRELIEEMRRVSENLEAGNWIKTGQAQLGEHLSGEQDSAALAKKILLFLAKYLNAQLGVLYVARERAEGQPYLKLLASYAYSRRKNLAGEYLFGEGLAGQAALEQQSILLARVPEDFVPIQSGLGEMPPKQLIAVPFVYEQKVKGVLELGFIQALTPRQQEFLAQIGPAVAVALHTAESRAAMQHFLEQQKHPHNPKNNISPDYQEFSLRNAD